MAGPGILVLAWRKWANLPRRVREPDLPYSTEIFGPGDFHPDKGKLSPIVKFGFPGVPASVASLGDSIGKIGIDLPKPWLTKILEESL